MFNNKDKDKLEHFDKMKLRNVCHHACSSMNYMNIIMIVIIFILIYHFFINFFMEKRNII